jgi:hypothetical protein
MLADAEEAADADHHALMLPLLSKRSLIEPRLSCSRYRRWADQFDRASCPERGQTRRPGPLGGRWPRLHNATVANNAEPMTSRHNFAACEVSLR